FYGLPLNTGSVILERRPAPVPEMLHLASAEVVPFHAGEDLRWSLVGGA
ncbi:MAG: dihydroorotase, partial [Phenylobacterium sp.]|nr:dihydroorotase [Phenylobacterium sp.]